MPSAVVQRSQLAMSLQDDSARQAPAWACDAFRHLPALRGKLRPAEQSELRGTWERVAAWDARAFAPSHPGIDRSLTAALLRRFTDSVEQLRVAQSQFQVLPPQPRRILPPPFRQIHQPIFRPP